MNNIININNYIFTPEDKLLFDTNIWFYLICPKDNPDKYAQMYFKALDKILHNKCKIFIDVIILSEFINRYAKYLAKQKFDIDVMQYEKFRDGKKFKAVALLVAEAVDKILELANRISSDFDSIEMNAILSHYAQLRADFNDQILEHICITNNLKLVTNDIDFKRAKCIILTANNKLLS